MFLRASPCLLGNVGCNLVQAHRLQFKVQLFHLNQGRVE
jgi:hypothetical protein